MTPATADTISFADLKAQQARIRARIDAAIARVLDHGQYIMGPEVGELERKLAAFTGARHALTCSSGTDALLIALMARGAGPGDAVLCPAFTYTATPETIALLGATPVFVDVDSATFNIDPAGLEAGLDAARKGGLKTKGLIAVDLFGLPAPYAAIGAFARDAGLWVLADAAQSFGSALAGQKAGTLAAITATSFFPAKPLGCYGDGGAIFTDDEALARIMNSIRLHGKGDGADKYDIARVGINGRLDTIQAAVLLEKLAIFDGEIAARRRLAQIYTESLGDVCMTPSLPAGAESAWAQYTVKVPAGSRADIIAALNADKVPTAIYYPRPLHHQDAYKHFPRALSGLAVSEALSREVVSLPMHPYVSDTQADIITQSVRRAISASSRHG